MLGNSKLANTPSFLLSNETKNQSRRNMECPLQILILLRNVPLGRIAKCVSTTTTMLCLR
jgi:hypothetical protein